MNKEDIIKEFREECQKEMGYISGVFMSQGDTKAENIVMPTKELLEVEDRLELYLFKALQAQKQEWIEGVKEIERERGWCKDRADRITQELKDFLKNQ